MRLRQVTQAEKAQRFAATEKSRLQASRQAKTAKTFKASESSEIGNVCPISALVSRGTSSFHSIRKLEDLLGGRGTGNFLGSLSSNFASVCSKDKTSSMRAFTLSAMIRL